MADEVRVKREILEAMLVEARRAPHQECCGLLAGRDGAITEILPAANALASATEYEIAPAELFRLFRRMRAAGLEHMGIYHSHPTGENSPSKRDIESAYYPEAVYFVLSPAAGAAKPIRAFRIQGGVAREVLIRQF